MQIDNLPAVSARQASSVYETDPMGPQGPPDYLNAVCRFTYADTAQVLLAQLQAIEALHGRVRCTERWTARPLDLDILLFGDDVIDEPDLQVPHIGIANRSFVLWPLRELDPYVQIPDLGAVSDLCQHCEHFGIKQHGLEIQI